MKNSYTRILGIAALAVAMLVGTVHAIPINGTLQFKGDVGASSGVNTTVTFSTQYVLQGTGDYLVVPSLFADGFPLNFASFAASLQYAGSGLGASLVSPLTPLWSVDGWSFDLQSISTAVLSITGGGLTIQGSGIAYGPAGFDPTLAVWSLQGSTTDGYTFVATSNSTAAAGVRVPDGGTTALLLGLGLLGMGLIRRSKKS